MSDKLIINRTTDTNFPYSLRLETEKLNNVREIDFCIDNFSWLTPKKHFIIEVSTPTPTFTVKPTIIECNFVKKDILLVKFYESNIKSQIHIATICDFVDYSDFSYIIDLIIHSEI